MFPNCTKICEPRFDSPHVSLMDKLRETDQAEEFRLGKESFHLLAYAHRDISNIGRQQLKRVVSDKYKQLCDDLTPLIGNWLGDDLEKQIKHWMKGESWI